MCLVVFIHNCYRDEVRQWIVGLNGNPAIFVENQFSVWLKLLISNGLARCAVPLFFLFAAFLQAKKDDKFFVLLRKRVKSLLIPYMSWMLIYAFFYGGLKLVIAKIAPQYLKLPDNNMLTWSFIDWFHKILGYKPDGAGDFDLPEFAGQFWFVRDLIILIILSPIIKYLIKKYLITFFLLNLAFYLIPARIFFVQNQALFFYCMGLYWGYSNYPLFKKIDNMPWYETLILFVLSFVYTYTFGGGLKTTSYYIMVIFDCFVFIKLSKLIVANETIFNYCSKLAGFSFFLFAIHAPVLNSYISKIWIYFFPMKNTFFSVLQYFIPTVTTIIIGTSIGILLKKIFPHIFKALNGGR